jgi:hypothetical protein
VESFNKCLVDIWGVLMDVGDVFEKYFLIFTVIPTLYWLDLVDLKTFSFFAPQNIPVYIGILLTSSQMFFSMDYRHKFLNFKPLLEIRINPSEWFPRLKLLLIVCEWVFSILTFCYMIGYMVSHQFDTVIMALFAFYAVVIIFAVLAGISTIILTLKSDFFREAITSYYDDAKKLVNGKN